MGGCDWRTLTSAYDGAIFEAFHVPPVDARLGGLVLIQEIFGVTAPLRDLAKGFAAEGFEVLAPSLFDRRAPGFQGAYDAEGVAEGRRLSEATPWDEVAADLATCVAELAGPVFVVGYCWGGTAAWLAACRTDGIAAVSSYYGRRIPELIAETPRAPIILHFGRQDPSIPASTVEAIAERHPEIPIHLYAAGHGFVSDRQADFNAEAAGLSRLRTLALFHRHMGLRGEV